ncbi:AI-2E family transporter [Yoonia litorea]|uniref:Predicted PurR-regulated permease PerM n=1 Tax=Yoonia litorea TaxID=1123755 RepID=A0A1I6MZU0_9RHOB|nr:AI-2E family transporter [Yoonia litorea]SFS21222.1 Predicted PurR-regulated permease PerM [Yoonia litorea]
MQFTIRTICLFVIASIAVLWGLREAEGLLAPVLSAFILGIVLTPVSELWDRLRFPAALGAFLTVSLALTLILVLAFFIEPYVSQAIRQLPIIQAELREALVEIRRMLQGLEKISEDVAAAIEPEDSGGESESSDEGGMGIPTLYDALFYAPRFIAQFLIFAGTLYFFLLTRNQTYHWLSANVAALGKKDLGKAAKQVSRYVLTISAINLGFGSIVAVAMHLIGMPSPILWGLLACVLNFVLYLGPLFLATTLTITGIVVFDGALSFAPVFLYVALNATEAQFVTPTLVGRSLAVNPLLVFLSLAFWLWLWGPIGGIIAIPLLIWVMTVMKGMSDYAISEGTPGKA